MSQEKLVRQLAELSAQIVTAREEIDRKHEKMQIALTNVLRLLSEEKGSTADKIRADPNRLKGYVLQALSQLRQDSLSLCDILKFGVDSIIKAARNP
jgi:multidrug resistance efflux pump